ncbi:hypothetical protein IHE44_0005276 [Lamprotornis superbus]|uniref:Heparan-sulfate 6-O-sulfotransferase n=1 Tax=Lamprotornis superbus TaxID=245042 RepID=A0A835NYM6_9PASS|nr:hypothetical protein IHE44_0005276 [Lamprotornis superbus]
MGQEVEEEAKTQAPGLLNLYYILGITAAFGREYVFVKSKAAVAYTQLLFQYEQGNGEGIGVCGFVAEEPKNQQYYMWREKQRQEMLWDFEKQILDIKKVSVTVNVRKKATYIMGKVTTLKIGRHQIDLRKMIGGVRLHVDATFTIILNMLKLFLLWKELESYKSECVDVYAHHSNTEQTFRGHNESTTYMSNQLNLSMKEYVRESSAEITIAGGVAETCVCTGMNHSRYIHCSYVGLDFPRSAGSSWKRIGCLLSAWKCPLHTLELGPLQHPAEPRNCEQRKGTDEGSIVKMACGEAATYLKKHTSRNFYYITMLRDPVSRYLSEWKHVQRGATWKTSLHMCDGRSPTPDELPTCYEGDDWSGVSLQEFMDCSYNLASNRQVRMLADLSLVGCYNLTFMNESERNMILLQSAKNNLKNMAFFGLTEFQRKTQYLFERTFNLKFISPFTQFNVTRASNVDIGEDVRQRIEELNFLDVQLYEYAKDLFLQRFQYSKQEEHQKNRLKRREERRLLREQRAHQWPREEAAEVAVTEDYNSQVARGSSRLAPLCWQGSHGIRLFYNRGKEPQADDDLRSATIHPTFLLSGELIQDCQSAVRKTTCLPLHGELSVRSPVKNYYVELSVAIPIFGSLLRHKTTCLRPQLCHPLLAEPKPPLNKGKHKSVIGTDKGEELVLARQEDSLGRTLMAGGKRSEKENISLLQACFSITHKRKDRGIPEHKLPEKYENNIEDARGKCVYVYVSYSFTEDESIIKVDMASLCVQPSGQDANDEHVAQSHCEQGQEEGKHSQPPVVPATCVEVLSSNQVWADCLVLPVTRGNQDGQGAEGHQGNHPNDCARPHLNTVDKNCQNVPWEAHQEDQAVKDGEIEFHLYEIFILAACQSLERPCGYCTPASSLYLSPWLQQLLIAQRRPLETLASIAAVRSGLTRQSHPKDMEGEEAHIEDQQEDNSNKPMCGVSGQGANDEHIAQSHHQQGQEEGQAGQQPPDCAQFFRAEIKKLAASSDINQMVVQATAVPLFLWMWKNSIKALKEEEDAAVQFEVEAKADAVAHEFTKNQVLPSSTVGHQEGKAGAFGAFAIHVQLKELPQKPYHTPSPALVMETQSGDKYCKKSASHAVGRLAQDVLCLFSSDGMKIYNQQPVAAVKPQDSTREFQKFTPLPTGKKGGVSAALKISRSETRSEMSAKTGKRIAEELPKKQKSSFINFSILDHIGLRQAIDVYGMCGAGKPAGITSEGCVGWKKSHFVQSAHAALESVSLHSGELDAKGSSLALKEVEAELQFSEGLLQVPEQHQMLQLSRWAPHSTRTLWLCISADSPYHARGSL